MSVEIEQVTTNRGRYYKWDGELFRSVTTILGAAIPAPWLANWKVKMAAEKAVDHHEAIGAMLHPELPGTPDYQGAVDFIKQAANRYRDDAADRGTQVHEACEAIALGAPFQMSDVRDDARPYIKGYLQFLADHKPEFTAMETMLASRRGWYAGQVDFRCITKGVESTVDIKTSKSLDAKMGLQLAAYNHAEFQVVNGVETPWAATEYCYVLHLKPNGTYKMALVDGSAENHEFFLAAREVYRWVTDNER